MTMKWVIVPRWFVLLNIQEINNEKEQKWFYIDRSNWCNNCNQCKKEGKIDVEEINRDPYLASKIKVLIDKGILNIKKLD